MTTIKHFPLDMECLLETLASMKKPKKCNMNNTRRANLKPGLPTQGVQNHPCVQLYPA